MRYYRYIAIWSLGKIFGDIIIAENNFLLFLAGRTRLWDVFLSYSYIRNGRCSVGSKMHTLGQFKSPDHGSSTPVIAEDFIDDLGLLTLRERLGASSTGYSWGRLRIGSSIFSGKTGISAVRCSLKMPRRSRLIEIAMEKMRQFQADEVMFSFVKMQASAVRGASQLGTPLLALNVHG